MDGAHGKDLTLPHTLVHDSIECILLAVVAWHGQYDVVVVHALETRPIITGKLMRLQRTASNSNFDPFALVDSILSIVCLILLGETLQVGLYIALILRQHALFGHAWQFALPSRIESCVV